MALHKKQHHFIKLPKNTTYFELLVLGVGSVEPIASIPQIIKLWQLQQAEEFSLFTWAFGLFASALWLVYGIWKKSTAIWFTSLLWIAVYIPIVLAIILYG